MATVEEQEVDLKPDIQPQPTKKIKLTPTNDTDEIKSKYIEFHHLYKKLRCKPKKFYKYMKMKVTTFDYIADAIRKECSHTATNFQEPISLEMRLLVTIRFLTTGISYSQLSAAFNISKAAVAGVIIEVCRTIWKKLYKKHIPVPKVSHFEHIAADFYAKFNFPNCVGSMDAKHLKIKSPSHSIILLAVADTNYKFLMVDVGSNTKYNDEEVFEKSPILQHLESGDLQLPPSRKLPNSEVYAPFVFVASESFPLRSYILRPFPKRRVQENKEAKIFNDSLLKAQAVFDCSFNIAASKFCFLDRVIDMKVANATCCVKAIMVLHNILLDLEGCDEESVNEIMSSFLTGRSFPLSKSNNRSTNAALKARKIFCEYFNREQI